jgi:hypothetical protein
MSVTVNKDTGYHDTAQDVKFKLHRLEMRNLHDKPSISSEVTLRATVGDNGRELGHERKKTVLSVDEMLAGFSSAEKGAAKTFLKAIEREAVKKIEELASEPHDDSDVFA